MNGPRLFARTHVAALAALMLLPACSPRKPIPSDPPEVRTEAQVRGAAKKSAPIVEQAPVAAAAPAPAPQPKAEAVPVAPAKADVLVAEVKTEPAAAPVAAVVETKPAEAKQAEAKAAEVKQVEVKAAEPSPAPAAAKAEAAKAEPAKADAAKAEAPKADAAKPEAAKAEASKVEANTPATAAVTAAASDATVKDAATKDAGTDTAKDAERPAMVQIASFGTEKNAQAALAWLKEKGYSEARVVRVEQAQTVYHRVQAGPFQDPAAARKALEELKVDWPQAFIPAD